MPTHAGRTDRASQEIDAPPQAIHAAFADPDQLMKWLPPQGMTGRALVYDFRPGGSYRIALTYEAPGAVGKTSDRTDVSAGRFLAIEPGRIVQSVEFDSSDAAFAGEMLLTWSFEPTPRGTNVSVTAENVPAGISQADHDAGLRSSLANLARFCGKP